MNYKIIFTLLFCLQLFTVLAQKYESTASTITFFSEAPVENIDATNKEASSVFDTSNNNIVFSVPIRGFEFDKSLMQEHFNEKYMESDEYPKSLFTGKVSGFDPNKKGEQKVSARGKLTIHGVTRSIDVEGTLERKNEELVLKSEFKVRLEDYNIKIPQVLWHNIAEEVEVKLNFKYQPL